MVLTSNAGILQGSKMPRKPDAPSWRNAAQCSKGARQRARVAAPDFVAAYSRAGAQRHC